MSKKHIGSRLDDFLAEEAMLEDMTAVAVKRVISWQIEQEMKTQMALMLDSTNKGQIDVGADNG